MEKNEFEKELVDALPLLFCHAFKLTGSEDGACELVQSVALKALAKYAYYVSDENFNGWLYSIVYNTFLNDCKRSSRSVATADFSFFDSGYRDDSIDSYDIYNAMNKLDVEYRSVFSLYADGYMYHEIAERLSMPLGTVKSRIHTARKRLREMLCEENG